MMEVYLLFLVGGTLGLYLSYANEEIQDVPWDSFRMGADPAEKTDHVIRMVGIWGKWYQPNLQELGIEFNHMVNDLIYHASVMKFHDMDSKVK